MNGGMTIGQLFVKIGADLSEMARVGDDLERALGPAQRRMQQLGTTLTASITLPLALAARSAVKAVASFDRMERAMGAVMGSAEAAEKEIDNLKETARLPGLGFPEAVKGSTLLQSVGFSADAAREAIEGFGLAIAATGGGRAELDRVLLQLQQMRSAGKLIMQDFRPIIQTVPLVGRAMQEAFGTSSLEAVRATGIATEDFISTLVQSLGNLEAVKGITGGIANSFENLKDEVYFAFVGMRGVIEPFVVQVLGAASKAVAFLAEGWKSLSPEMQKAMGLTALLAGSFGPLLLAVSGVMAALPALASGFAAMFGPIGLAVQAVAGAAVAIVANWDKVKDYVEGPLGKIEDEVREIFSSVRIIVKDIMASIRQLVAYGLEWITEFWEKWGGTITTLASYAWNGIKSIITTALKLIADTFGLFVDLLSGDWEGLWQRMKSIAFTVLRFVATTFLNAVSLMLQGLHAVVKEIPIIGDAIGKAQESVEGAMRSVRGAFMLGTLAIQGTAEALNEDLTEGANNATNTITNAGDQILDTARTLKQRLEDLNVLGGLWGRSPAAVLRDQANEIHDEINRLIVEEGLAPDSQKVQALMEQWRQVMLQIPKVIKDAAEGGLELDVPVRLKLPEEPEEQKRYLSAAAERFQDMATRVGMIMQRFVADTTTKLFEGIGRIAAGTASFADVGRELLASIAGVMGQLGGLLIAFGTAGLIFAGSGGMLSFLANPLAAIAAGGLLVAAGAAIKGLLSRASSGSGGTAARSTSFTYNPNRSTGPRGARPSMNADVSLRAAVVPSGDIVFAQDEGRRRQDKYGTQLK